MPNKGCIALAVVKKDFLQRTHDKHLQKVLESWCRSNKAYNIVFKCNICESSQSRSINKLTAARWVEKLRNGSKMIEHHSQHYFSCILRTGCQNKSRASISLGKSFVKAMVIILKKGRYSKSLWQTLLHDNVIIVYLNRQRQNPQTSYG